MNEEARKETIKRKFMEKFNEHKKTEEYAMLETMLWALYLKGAEDGIEMHNELEDIL